MVNGHGRAAREEHFGDAVRDIGHRGLWRRRRSGGPVRPALRRDRAGPLDRVSEADLHDDVRLCHGLAAALLRRRGVAQTALRPDQPDGTSRRRDLGPGLRRNTAGAVPGPRRQVSPRHDGPAGRRHRAVDHPAGRRVRGSLGRPGRELDGDVRRPGFDRRRRLDQLADGHHRHELGLPGAGRPCLCVPCPRQGQPQQPVGLDRDLDRDGTLVDRGWLRDGPARRPQAPGRSRHVGDDRRNGQYLRCRGRDQWPRIRRWLHLVRSHRAGAPVVAGRSRRDGGLGRGQLIDHDLCGPETADQCHRCHRHARRVWRRKWWRASRHPEWRWHHRHDPARMVDERGHRQPRAHRLARRRHPARGPGHSRDRSRGTCVRLGREDRERDRRRRDLCPPARRDQGLRDLDRSLGSADLP